MAGLQSIADQGEAYGKSARGAGAPILFEYVSANPNGPLSVAHGRGGVVGDTLARLYAFSGHEVRREFYVNDATSSAQMTLFARSVWARYRQLNGDANAALPEDGYFAEYVSDIARAIAAAHGDRYKTLPETDALSVLEKLSREAMLARQQTALADLGVSYDTWFSESELHRTGAVADVLEKLRASGNAYEAGGALWLRSSAFGDDNDRVLLRATGAATYLLGDLAYHHNKFERGFSRLVNVWGTDHSGYVGRTKAGLAAMGFDPASLHIVLCHPVRVVQEGAEVKEWGGGSGVTLDELTREAGRDAVRFILLQNAPDAPLDFDLDLARGNDKANPLYRVRATLARAAQRAEASPPSNGNVATNSVTPAGESLAARLRDFPDEVEQAATQFAPHRIARYVVEVADLFDDLCAHGGDAPLFVCAAVQTTLANALSLLGIAVSAAPSTNAYTNA